MKIGIISDTHDRTPGIDGAFEIFGSEGVGLVLGCGDWTTPGTMEYVRERAAGMDLKGVLGNNDRDVAGFLKMNRLERLELVEGVLRLDLEGKKIAVYHGHHKPTLRGLLNEPLDLLCLGHSHKPRYDRLKDENREKVILNPGSTAFSIPRSSGWQASVAVYDTSSHEAEFFYF